MSGGNVKRFEWKLGRTGLIIVIVGMVILLCSSFLLGVGVGKNIDAYPEKIASAPQRFLALFWRRAKVDVGQKVIAGKENQIDKNNMDLSFHDALTSRKPLPINNLPDNVGKKQDDVVVVHQEKKPSAVAPPGEEVVSAKEEVSEQDPPVVEKLPMENKSKIKEVPQPDSRSFLIHVVSLKDREKAREIDKAVSKMGYSSKVVRTEIKGKGTWYRVVATGFETKTKAQIAAGKISRKVKTNCIIRATGVNATRKS
jgi:cell division protein FtsN